MIIDIVRSNFKIIIFGFVFTFFSCIGQSFFIGLFNSNIRDELNITHGEFGTIYGIATLCSSLTLIWLGKKIDDLKLVNYSLLVVTFLSLAALFFSFVNGLIFLAIGIFFLRLSGQGLMAHTASVAISRFFERSRGKALSYTWIGMSFGEFFLPVIIVYFLTFIYWRSLWQGFAIIIILLLPIFTYLTIKEINIFSRENKTENNVKKINKIIHPEVRLRMNKFLNKNKKKKAVVLDIPLLLEGKINKKKDILVFVEAKKKEINKRLKKRGNFNLKIFKKLKKLQLPLEIKKKKSNFILKNNFKSLSVKKNVKILKNKVLINERSSSRYRNNRT